MCIHSYPIILYTCIPIFANPTPTVNTIARLHSRHSQRSKSLLSPAASTLESWVWISFEAWICMFVSPRFCACLVLCL
jgi:hypothetical protein